MVLQLTAPGLLHHKPLTAGPRGHVGCQLGEPGPVASLDEHPRARAEESFAGEATTARPGSSGHAKGRGRRGLPFATLKRRRRHVMVTGAKLYGNGGRWRGTATVKRTQARLRGHIERGKWAGGSDGSPRGRVQGRRGRGRRDTVAIDGVELAGTGDENDDSRRTLASREAQLGEDVEGNEAKLSAVLDLIGVAHGVGIDGERRS